MRLMEYFGFASGNSSSGPNFPFLAESVLKDYPAELTEHPAMPSLSPYDFVSVDWSSLYRGFVDSYFSTFQSPITRSISAGIIAAAVIYCAWKVSVVWNDGITLGRLDEETGFEVQQVKTCKLTAGGKIKDRSRSGPSKPADLGDYVTAINNSAADDVPPEVSAASRVCEKSIGPEQLATVSETFQRQLLEALSKLDDVRYRLKELESEKELLAAEIDLRRKVTQKLQEENSNEREKRQQAELRMEMMEIENSQLRQLRKELALKSGQVDRLEKFMKEKDDLQIKLFEENVVIPRAVAEARAKELGALQTRVHRLQSEIDASKSHQENDPGCLSTASSNMAKQENGTAASSVPMASEVPVTSDKNILDETSLMPVETYYNRVPNTKRRLADKSPHSSRSVMKSSERSPKYSRSMTSPVILMSKKIPQGKSQANKEICAVKKIQPITNFNVATVPSMGVSDGLIDSFGASCNKGTSVFAQIKALISGFRDSSSDSDFASPSATSAVVSDQGTASKDTDNNNLFKNEEYPLSDGQSSLFMSATDGSGTSDSEQMKTPINGINKSLGKKALPVKRLSRCKRDRKRDKDRLRRLMSHLAGGQDAAVNIGEASTLESDSSDRSRRSTVKSFPIASRAGSKSQLCSKCPGDSQDTRATTPESSDENDGDSGDSWIVILPAAS